MFLFLLSCGLVVGVFLFMAGVIQPRGREPLALPLRVLLGVAGVALAIAGAAGLWLLLTHQITLPMG